MPWVTVGWPPRPRALPIATTAVPTPTAEELPHLMVGRWLRPATFITAMSWDGSLPTKLAACLPWPGTVTAMLSAPETTWLLVTIRPPELTTIPVPAPAVAPLPASGSSAVFMSTTAGSTAFATAAVSIWAGAAVADAPRGAASRAATAAHPEVAAITETFFIVASFGCYYSLRSGDR
jgi:hypothetical protein